MVGIIDVRYVARLEIGEWVVVEFETGRCARR